MSPVLITLVLIGALSALVYLAVPSHADWKNLDGQKVPEVTAKEWLNVEGKTTPSVASLRGKVYLLEFFATW